MKRHALLAMACLAVAGMARAQDLPDPGQTYIEGFAYSGQGCRQGTVAQNLSQDRQALTLLFSEFGVEGGHQLGVPQKEIGCVLNLTVHVPQGYSFSILQIDTRGYANIAPNTVGYSRTAFRWGHSPVGLTQLSESRMNGPYQDDFISSTTIRSESLAWSPCAGVSQPLTIGSTVGVNGQLGYINVDSIDTSFVTEYKLKWRRCTDPGSGFPVGRLGTQGQVARDTSMCVNFRQGVITISTAAAPKPNQSFAKLTHYATSVTGVTREMAKESFNANRTDVYKLPGDWNSVLDVQPQVNATAVVAGARPIATVEQIAPDTKCVRIANAPANVAIQWNPRQP